MRLFALVLSLLTANEEYSRFITAASRLFENLEYERALEQLANAKKVAKTADEQTEVAMYEGVLLFELGRTDDAKAALQTALFLSPDAKVPVKVSPKVNQQVEAVRAKVKQELAPIIAKRDADAREAKEKERQKEEIERKRKAEEDAKAKAAAEKAARPPPVVKVEPTPPQTDEPGVTPPPKLEPEPAPVEPQPVVIAQPEPGPKKKGVPIVALVFTALGAGSGITASIFGAQSQALVAQAEMEMWHTDAAARLDEARPKALIANVMFAVTGALLLGAVISAIVWAASE